MPRKGTQRPPGSMEAWWSAVSDFQFQSRSKSWFRAPWASHQGSMAASLSLEILGQAFYLGSFCVRLAVPVRALVFFLVITPPGEPQHLPDKWGIGGATLHRGWVERSYLHTEPERKAKQEVEVFHAPSGGLSRCHDAVSRCHGNSVASDWMLMQSHVERICQWTRSSLSTCWGESCFICCFIPLREAKAPTKTLAVIRSKPVVHTVCFVPFNYWDRYRPQARLHSLKSDQCSETPESSSVFLALCEPLC